MQKKITRLEHPRHHHMVGDGFRVAQYIPGYGREMGNDTSPFLMLDYNAPWTIPPQTDWHRPGVGYHPHRGFETVTIVYSGEVEHQDTAGNGGVIGADEVQWMTAGSGLLHNEFMTHEFSRTWGVQHAVQLWVNLPREYKMTPPRYQALTRENIPEIVFDGGVVRVIAGKWIMNNYQWKIIEQAGVAETFSPVELSDVRFFVNSTEREGRADASLRSEWQSEEKRQIVLNFPEGYNAMILVTEWSITVNEKILENGDMIFLSREGTELCLEYNGKNPQSSTGSDNSTIIWARVLVMAGKPLDEPVAAYGPFVMNTQSEIMQAFADLNAGKMGAL